jgi:hypothetical protein
MTYPSEYHKTVKDPYQRAIPATLALFGLLLLIASASAQISQSNSSSSAHSGSFAPPTGSVAPPTGAVAPRTGSVAPPTGAFVHNSFANSSVTFSTTAPHQPGSPHFHDNSNTHHRDHHNANDTVVYPYLYGVPYAIDGSNANTSNNGDDAGADDADYQGGPTIFDRRGPGPDAYIPPSFPGPAHAPDVSAEPAPESPQPVTTIVFKDGHQIEVSNYAIVSQTLYDLTPGHPRRIALADLDLPATQKQNDDRGVTFQLPN